MMLIVVPYQTGRLPPLSNNPSDWALTNAFDEPGKPFTDAFHDQYLSNWVLNV